MAPVITGFNFPSLLFLLTPPFFCMRILRRTIVARDKFVKIKLHFA
ncbi:unknown protein [Cronobacter turicensis z3032]|uniref:Uncharacterized protein n=1 Tax=Cronobacter turicensis (strain DSM 18703 / CCUG 55852 / LMG 23827 / z3032) TaxID=693216 RepID=C9XV52_CROTZ|nr:unknown protein [Cronobacter turicensis z3032]